MSEELRVPFFRLDLGEDQIEEVVATLRSGWLTSGPKARDFEARFAEAVGAKHAQAVSSCTAAMHLAVEALGLREGDAVLVPTMTFAATAEVVRYQGAMPILVDCEADSLNIDFSDARRKAEQVHRGELTTPDGSVPRLVGIIPVHVGGAMCDMRELERLRRDLGVWVVEDAAHAFPAAWRSEASGPWRACGPESSDVTCFSFYANKTITTGEGGMAVTNRSDLFERMRIMALHGLTLDAWRRHEEGGDWDYKIVAPGFKYNMSDLAASLGLHQLARAEALRQARERVVQRYFRELAEIEAIECPPAPANRRHAWHIFPVKLRLERLRIDRNQFIDELKGQGIFTSVHWRPLHLHPYYRETFAWSAADCPTASRVWQRLVTLPLFPSMTDREQERVIEVLGSLCRQFGR